jgi:hypothetical protein
VDHTDQGIGTFPQSTMTPNWIINVSDVRGKKYLGITLATAINSRIPFMIWILVVKNMIFSLDC